MATELMSNNSSIKICFFAENYQPKNLQTSDTSMVRIRTFVENVMKTNTSHNTVSTAVVTSYTTDISYNTVNAAINSSVTNDALNRSETINRSTNDIHHRVKRSHSIERNVEVMVVADSEMRRFHTDNLEHYILTLMAIVSHVAFYFNLLTLGFCF